jgi:hypothetical protein
MADDTTPVEIGSSDGASGKNRWRQVVVGVLVVAGLGLGTWQVVDLHHEVSDLQTQMPSSLAIPRAAGFG